MDFTRDRGQTHHAARPDSGGIDGGGTVGSLGDTRPTAAGGLPGTPPPRPATPAVYPAVHDLPPPRTDVLPDGEGAKLEADFIGARTRNTAGNTAGGARKP